MGPGETASTADQERAEQIGALIAHRGWTLLTGGRAAGVMQAACRGAKQSGGLVIGVLPGKDTEGMSEFVDIPIITDEGSARNNINVLSSRVVVACGISAGTASEISLAIKAKRHVVMLCDNEEAKAFFKSLSPELITISDCPEDAIDTILSLLENEEFKGPWIRPQQVAACKES